MLDFKVGWKDKRLHPNRVIGSFHILGLPKPCHTLENSVIILTGDLLFAFLLVVPLVGGREGVGDGIGF